MPRATLAFALLAMMSASPARAQAPAGPPASPQPPEPPGKFEYYCDDDDEPCLRRRLSHQLRKTLDAVNLVLENRLRETFFYGLGLAFTGTSSPARQTSTHASLLSARYGADLLNTRLKLDMRGRSFFQLGDGTGSYQLHYRVEAAIGKNLADDPTHGPLLRGGFRYHFQGNDRLLSSMLALPEVQLGYGSRSSDQERFELTARVAPVLIGRFKPEGESQRLGGRVAWGGHLALGLPYADVDLDWTRIQGDASTAPLDQWTGMLCGQGPRLGFRAARRDVRLVICATGQLWRGGLSGGQRHDLGASQVTWSIGLG